MDFHVDANAIVPFARMVFHVTAVRLESAILSLHSKRTEVTVMDISCLTLVTNLVTTRGKVSDNTATGDFRVDESAITMFLQIVLNHLSYIHVISFFVNFASFIAFL
jgi:hypothetical protein